MAFSVPIAVIGSQSIVLKCKPPSFSVQWIFPVTWKPYEKDSVLSGTSQYMKRPRGNISIIVIVYAVQSCLVNVNKFICCSMPLLQYTFFLFNKIFGIPKPAPFVRTQRKWRYVEDPETRCKILYESWRTFCSEFRSSTLREDPGYEFGSINLPHVLPKMKATVLFRYFEYFSVLTNGNI